MEYSFGYEKRKVIQGLRYHFITRPEIKGMLIAINLFAIISAILFYMHKIQPLPFLISSVLWILLMITFWMILPSLVYRRAKTFQDKYTATLDEEGLKLKNDTGIADWKWSMFVAQFESPMFFHLYFSPRSFFMLPKDQMPQGMESEVRELLKLKIPKRKK